MSEARRGAILPHAPLLIPDVSPQVTDPAVARVRRATREVGSAFTRPTAVISPHGSRSGVYIHPRADLRAFGVPRVDARSLVPEGAAHDLARRWDKPVMERRPDHGVAVPVLLGPLECPVVGVALAEDADAEDAEGLATALAETDLDVVVSANTGAGITDRAPLTRLEGSEELERGFRESLEKDAGSISDHAVRLATEGGSCSTSVLLVFARLFAKRRVDVIAHEWPFGVGYLVGRVEPAA